MEDGSGAGLLTRQGGNCYVIMPTHVHGSSMDGIRLGSGHDGGPIGTARIVHIAPDDADISLGVVRGGLEETCGDDWTRLPRSVANLLTPGTALMLQRPRQRVFEGRRLIVHSSGPDRVRLVPAPGEKADLFGGTSGAVALHGDTPVAMVLDASDASAAFALRMDAVRALVGEVLAERPRARDLETVLSEAAQAETSAPDPVSGGAASLPPGDPVEAVEWSAHPVDESVDPATMLEGGGAWVFELGEEPVRLTLRLTETDRLSRIRMRAAPGTAAGVPRKIGLVTDSSSDPARPLRSEIPAPEMTLDGEFDLRIAERFARTVTITIETSWSAGAIVRLDALSID